MISAQDESDRCDGAAVRRYVERICFKTGPPELVGVELEWLIVRPDRPHEPVGVDVIRRALDHASGLPGGSAITFEPGGQVELSSAPARGLNACWRTVDNELSMLRERLEAEGLTVAGRGIDPLRSPLRQLHTPRYGAMERYFDNRGSLGRVMMCSTAAVHVNVDVGADEAQATRRWRLLHALGPVLSAVFANSPRRLGRATGWKSTRQAVWLRLDPSRTHPPSGADPAGAWTRYLMNAPVMVRRKDPERWDSDPGHSFGEWVDGAESPAPTTADLAYHVGTLFPPVRPQGRLEVRYVDCQAPRYWAVPLAVVTALTESEAAGALALSAAVGLEDAWLPAARHGMGRRDLAAAGRACFEAAAIGLAQLEADPDLRRLVEEFADRYPRRGRCPADDPLERLCRSRTSRDSEPPWPTSWSGLAGAAGR